ncbi:MAG: sugar phosphate nucleotidyltransferase [Salinivirgaceae bacterium]|jgi:MurNAc alpha-1-phosphate uridylyltransferase|nr:sugar phosphate nucleotidyltransferase [Salinivirgaceae bacterium]
MNQDEIVAFIPAAGLGTRLAPLTDNCPKALVCLQGKTMLENVLERLSKVGICRFIVNVHHFPEQMYTAISELQKRYAITISDERNGLLDTGGGVAKAVSMLQNEEHVLLVHNVDVVVPFSYEKLIHQHLQSGSQVTFAVSERETSRKLVFQNGALVGWINSKTGESRGDISAGEPFAFSGVHIVNKGVFENTEVTPFPLIPFYLNFCVHKKMELFEHSPNGWYDLGTVKRLEKAKKTIDKNRSW